MTLVVPSLDNIFMVLLISEVVQIGATKPFFFILVPLEGRGGVRACVGICYAGIVHILNSRKKTLFSLSLTAICAELCCQTT